MTPEWLWNLSSAVPALLLGWWVWWTVGWLWRRTLWARIGVDARALAGSVDPVPVWGGWRITHGGATVTWRGGLMGMSTRVSMDSGRQQFSELLDADRVRNVIGG